MQNNSSDFAPHMFNDRKFQGKATQYIVLWIKKTNTTELEIGLGLQIGWMIRILDAEAPFFACFVSPSTKRRRLGLLLKHIPIIHSLGDTSNDWSTRVSKGKVTTLLKWTQLNWSYALPVTALGEKAKSVTVDWIWSLFPLWYNTGQQNKY